MILNNAWLICSHTIPKRTTNVSTRAPPEKLASLGGVHWQWPWDSANLGLLCRSSPASLYNPGCEHQKPAIQRRRYWYKTCNIDATIVLCSWPVN